MTDKGWFHRGERENGGMKERREGERRGQSERMRILVEEWSSALDLLASKTPESPVKLNLIKHK